MLRVPLMFQINILRFDKSIETIDKGRRDPSNYVASMLMSISWSSLGLLLSASSNPFLAPETTSSYQLSSIVAALKYVSSLSAPTSSSRSSAAVEILFCFPIVAMHISNLLAGSKVQIITTSSLEIAFSPSLTSGFANVVRGLCMLSSIQCSSPNNWLTNDQRTKPHSCIICCRIH